MKRSLHRGMLAASLFMMALLGVTPSAHAWYKVKNATPNPMSVAYAYASTSGFLCGYNDGCDDNSTRGFRVKGYFNIAPGGVSVLNSKTYGNAQHYIWAIDTVGHVWSGNGGAFATPFGGPFDRCEPMFKDLDLPYQNYIAIRKTTCCGGSCQSDSTSTLVLR